MTTPRFVRDFPAPPDPWSIVDRWASSQGYVPIAAGDETRTYRKGAGFWVGSRILQVRVGAGVVHLEAWVAANGLARLFSLYILPREITIEPGGMKAVLPRKMGQREVDGLLLAMGQPPVAAGPAGVAGWTAQPVATKPLVTSLASAPSPSASGPTLPAALPPPPFPPTLMSGTASGSPAVARPWHQRWPVRVAAILILLGAIAVLATRALSSPSIDERNAAAARGRAYETPRALSAVLGDAGVPCGAFTKGEDALGPVGNIMWRAGNCLIDGRGVTMTVYTRGPLMKDTMDVSISTWLEAMRDYDPSPLLLVGPNWTVSADDDEVLFDVQDAIGGTLRE